ncbi:16S rRNA (cytidine(1402)-2'-O)-methyltransferase [Arboricoccus pini]|nr:16S rRNA (cytidine(1402)-2'-O)-methyltransferase [Arboricoccus pini]
MAPGLYVVATPIGNLGDLSPRAGELLRKADLVLCEDTRVTMRLMQHLGIRRRLMAYNDHNAPMVRPIVMEKLRASECVALVSDAGTPCISDPGFKLVREAADAGIAVRAVPGASAVLAALSIAGLPTDRFLFAGFLPPRQAARRSTLTGLAALDATLVFLESPGRLADMLADAAATLGQRQAAVARELTKLFEEVRRGPLEELAAHYAHEGQPKGEITVVIGPPSGDVATPADLDQRLRDALLEMRPRQAAAAVASATGLPVNRLYERILELRRLDEGG